jgi:hypothetical protein
MRGRLRVLGCLLAATVLVSGCGSTKRSSAGTTSATAGATAPVSRQTVPQRARKKESQHAGAPKAEAKPKPEPTVTEILRKRKVNERAAARTGLEIAESDLPFNRRYPKELQGRFMLACKAAKGSTSSCECIIVRQEANLKIERGRSLAELLALELAFEREHASLRDIRRRRVRSPRVVRRAVRECTHEAGEPRRASK